MGWGNSLGIGTGMVMLIPFLVIGIASNIHAMEIPPKKEAKKHRYLNVTNRSRSASPSDAPTSIFSESGCSLRTPKKTSKSGKQDSDSSDNSLTVRESDLLGAVSEDKTLKVMSILHPDVNLINSKGKPLLTITIQNDNVILVQELLAHKGIDVNKTDAWGNTPLHHAALACNQAIIYLLLFDSRVNSFIKNKAGLFAHQLIDSYVSAENLSLKLILFARSTLDNVVAQEVSYFQIDKQSNNVAIMNDAIGRIKECIENDHRVQESYQALPEETKLPPYATDAFIRDMILYRLESKRGDVVADTRSLKSSTLHVSF